MVQRVIGVLALLQVSLSAAVVWDASTGVAEAGNFWYQHQDKSNETFLAFTEATDVHIPEGELWVQGLNQWDHVAPADLIRIDVSQASLDSHMIYYCKAVLGDRTQLRCEVTFDAPIVGFLADGYLFGTHHPLFAPHPTHKQPAAAPNKWSLEEGASWTPLDRVDILGPNKIACTFTLHSATDPLRVITIRSGSVSPELHEYIAVDYDVPPAAPVDIEATLVE